VGPGERANGDGEQGEGAKDEGTTGEAGQGERGASKEGQNACLWDAQRVRQSGVSTGWKKEVHIWNVYSVLQIASCCRHTTGKMRYRHASPWPCLDSSFPLACACFGLMRAT